MPKLTRQDQIKGIMKRRVVRAMMLPRDTPEQRLLVAVIRQAIEDHDATNEEHEPLCARGFLDDVWPDWKNVKEHIEANFDRAVAA